MRYLLYLNRSTPLFDFPAFLCIHVTLNNFNRLIHNRCLGSAGQEVIPRTPGSHRWLLLPPRTEEEAEASNQNVHGPTESLLNSWPPRLPFPIPPKRHKCHPERDAAEPNLI